MSHISIVTLISLHAELQPDAAHVKILCPILALNHNVQS